MPPMTLMLWLAGPVVAGCLASVWAWWLNRPARRPSTAGAMRSHSRYLDAIATPARGTGRVEPGDASPLVRIEP